MRTVSLSSKLQKSTLGFRTREGMKKRLHTGSWAIIELNCGPERTFDACKNSSSVRMIDRERSICAGSGILILGFILRLLVQGRFAKGSEFE